MDRLGWGRWGLWVFTLGMVAWVVANAGLDLFANVFTDIAIAIAAAIAAVGLPRTVDGIGNGPFRGGLLFVGLAQLIQNVITASTKLDAGNAAPVFVVIAASAALVVGIKLWQFDGWDSSAFPWLMAGFAGFAFEPLYYFVKGALAGSFLGPFTPGAVLVAVGAGMAAWAFSPLLEDVAPIEPEVDVPAKVRRARA